MKNRHRPWFGLLLICFALILSTGCMKKVEVRVSVPPALAEMEYRYEISRAFTPHRSAPPGVLPPLPVASLASDRELILRGETITLTWHTDHATVVTIDPIGPVPTNGSLTSTPSDSIKYHLVAEGPGGVDVATVWVTVKTPPDGAAVSPESARTGEDLSLLRFQSIFFDYDRYAIRPDQRQALEDNVQLLVGRPDIRIVIEGYCDDRGSTEYNLMLGEERAEAVKQALVQQGVSPEQIKTASFGKERPFCLEHTEDCAQRNRRVQIVPDKPNPLN